MKTTLATKFVACLAAGMLGACVSASSSLAQVIEIKISHYLPPSQTIHKELTRWSEELKEKSGGRLQATVYPSGQMGPLPRQFDLARTGVADMAFFLPGILPGRFPMTEALQLPFIFNKDANTTQPISTSAASAIVTSQMADLGKEFTGTKVLYFIATPTGSLFFSKATVHRPTDLKGLRIRHNGPISSATIQAWGGTPVSVLPAELGDALQKGTIDGMFMNYEGGQALQLIADTHTVTELNSGAGVFVLAMNQEKYDSLPADLRKLIDDTTGVAAARRVGALYDQAEATGRAYAVTQKVDIIKPDLGDYQAFRTASTNLVTQTMDDLEKKNLPAKRLFGDIAKAVAGVTP